MEASPGWGHRVPVIQPLGGGRISRHKQTNETLSTRLCGGVATLEPVLTSLTPVEGCCLEFLDASTTSDILDTLCSDSDIQLILGEVPEGEGGGRKGGSRGEGGGRKGEGRGEGGTHKKRGRKMGYR